MNWPEPLWLSYEQNQYAMWTMADLADQETVNRAVLPLLVETVLVAILCMKTIYDAVERRTWRQLPKAR